MNLASVSGCQMQAGIQPFCWVLVSFCGVSAEIWMVLGYFLFEGFLYGFGPSLVNIPANAAQGVAGVVIGCVLIKILEKTKLLSGKE